MRLRLVAGVALAAALATVAADFSTDDLTADSEGDQAPISNVTIANVTKIIVNGSLRFQGPLLHCQLNCFGNSSEAVDLPGDTGGGLELSNIDECREFCLTTDECEAIVYGQGRCWGKQNVKLSECPQGGGVYVTELISKMPADTCTVFGEHHVFGFDDPRGASGRPSVSEGVAGDFYLVRSRDIQIQGRFRYTSRFPTRAALQGVAVSGNFLRNQTLVIEYTNSTQVMRGFTASWQNQSILTEFPSNFSSSLVKAYADSITPGNFKDEHFIGNVIYAGNHQGKLPAVLVELAQIRLALLLFNQSMDAVIQMRKLPGPQDGFCGDFNCASADDQLVQKPGLDANFSVGPEDCLFSTPAGAVEPQPIDLGTFNCTEARWRTAELACNPLAGGQRAACWFDVCSTGLKRAGAEDATTVALQGLLTEKKFGQGGDHPVAAPPPSRRRGERLGAARLPSAVHWALPALLVASLAMGIGVGWRARQQPPATAACRLVTAPCANKSFSVDEGKALLRRMPTEDEDEGNDLEEYGVVLT